MTDDLSRMVRELHDRQAILDQIHNYCRGIDRFDRELLLGVYHKDAIDDHGLFIGGPEAFVDWSFNIHEQAQIGQQHIVTNHTCELDGDVAHTETYWLVIARNRIGDPVTVGTGRYIDRFEKRDGTWRIAQRKCVPEWVGESTVAMLSAAGVAAMSGSGTVSRDRSDVSYERPLRIPQRRLDQIGSGKLPT